ncbi:MAG: hypothetical protein DMF71_17115, partial [Acidobacteria bacterium]
RSKRGIFTGDDFLGGKTIERLDLLLVESKYLLVNIAPTEARTGKDWHMKRNAAAKQQSEILT